MKFSLLLVIALVAFVATQNVPCENQADENAIMNKVMPIKYAKHLQYIKEGRVPQHVPSITGEKHVCRNGMAKNEYFCNNVDMLSFVNMTDLGSSYTGSGSDMWGWESAAGKEVAIMGVSDGTSFVDVTDPINPIVLGFLKSSQKAGTNFVIWRDMKVYKDYVFIISESTDHGMQIFNLNKLYNSEYMSGLKKSSNGVTQLTEDTVYRKFGSCHNIAINEETGFAYAVGTKTCKGGLHMVNIEDPTNPQFAGCYCGDGYTHDAQIVTYDGPDSRYAKEELAFCFNEDTLTIVNVTDKSNPIQVSRTGYQYHAYTHQGWLFNNQQYVLMNDELDEVEHKFPQAPHTRSMVWDISDLENPKFLENGGFFSSQNAIDHNLYVKGDLAFESNYCAGLRVLNVAKPHHLHEVAYFDVSPDCESAEFLGSWSNYPYFKSGTIAASCIERGLFILKANVHEGDHSAHAL